MSYRVHTIATLYETIMRIIKQSRRSTPKVSLVLVDWSVRESFHILHYLRNQTVPRDDYEVVIVEYYDHVSKALKEFEGDVDTWITLGMPKDCYYHKHLMYNAGIVASRGDIVMIGDSDAMVREVFIETIINAFAKDPKIVYHLDQFRNVRRDFYPFNYPGFEEVLGAGCINNVGGQTTGILDEANPLHSRNYGACMCARRADLVAIGGADEDKTYLGHICGPYDMTFRLMNFSRRLIWDTREYIYHTWHPGSGGEDNYVGPHDGKGVSTTALQALIMGRFRPQVENGAIRKIRERPALMEADISKLKELLIDKSYHSKFHRDQLGTPVKKSAKPMERIKDLFATYKGVDIFCFEGMYYGISGARHDFDIRRRECRKEAGIMKAHSFQELQDAIDRHEPHLLETVGRFNIVYSDGHYYVVPQRIGSVNFFDEAQRNRRAIKKVKSLDAARKLLDDEAITNASIDIVRKIGGRVKNILKKNNKQ